jgi:hypothetical protein
MNVDQEGIVLIHRAKADTAPGTDAKNTASGTDAENVADNLIITDDMKMSGNTVDLIIYINQLSIGGHMTVSPEQFKKDMDKLTKQIDQFAHAKAQNFDELLPLILRIMQVVSGFKYLSGVQKKQIAVGSVNRMIVKMEISTESKLLLQTACIQFLPAIIDTIYIANQGIYDFGKKIKKCCM